MSRSPSCSTPIATTTHIPSSLPNHDPLVHLSLTLSKHQARLVKLYSSLGHADPQTCAANKISDLHLGILDTIDAQAHEAELEVAQLTKASEDIIDQIIILRNRLGHADLPDFDLSLPNEPLVPKLDRLKTVEADLINLKCDREIKLEIVTKKLESYSPVLESDYIQQIISKASLSLRKGKSGSCTLVGSNLSLEYIARLEQECGKCEEEVTRRTELLLDHLNEVFNLWGHLGISPSTPSSSPETDHSDIDPVVLSHLGFKDVAVTVNGDIKPIGHCESVKMVPTTNNLDKVAARRTWLDSERQKREDEIQRCYDELCILWARLGVPEEEQEQFVESWRGLSEQCVEGYQAELLRMTTAKKEHMVIFVEKEREQIIELWDQMYVGELERTGVKIMGDDDYSEELLASHEQIKQDLIEELNDRKPILSILNKYFTLLQEAHELELAEKDPNRFAKGKRGDPGRLLREEKIRKRVTKEKPKLENDLKTMIPKWENERGRPFLVNGSRFVEDLVIRLEQEAATKGQASSRSKATVSSASVKRQQTGPQSRTASPVKRTRTDGLGTKPPVSMRGSANPFGTATPRVASKAGSAVGGSRTRLAAQTTGGGYNMRGQRSTGVRGAPGTLLYQQTGSSMASYNPITPTPHGRVAPAMLASTSTGEPCSSSDGRASSAQSTSTRPTEPSTRSVSGASCPGIPPNWPSTSGAMCEGVPSLPNTKYTAFVAPQKSIGMPAPPLKKGIFRPRPSSVALPVVPGGPPPLGEISQNCCVGAVSGGGVSGSREVGIGSKVMAGGGTGSTSIRTTLSSSSNTVQSCIVHHHLPNQSCTLSSSDS